MSTHNSGICKNDLAFISTALTFVFCCGGREKAGPHGSPQRPRRLQEATAEVLLGLGTPPGALPAGSPLLVPPPSSPRPGEGPPPRSRSGRAGAGRRPERRCPRTCGAARAERPSRAARPDPGGGRHPRCSARHLPPRRPLPRTAGSAAADPRAAGAGLGDRLAGRGGGAAVSAPPGGAGAGAG